MDPISNLNVPTLARGQENVSGDVVIEVPCITPPPICLNVTTTSTTAAASVAASTTTTAASGYYCATSQRPPQANAAPGTTSDMPLSLSSTDNTTGSDNHYHLTPSSPVQPEHTTTIYYTPDTVNPLADTHQLLQQPLPYFTIYNNIPNPTLGTIYPPTDSQQILTAGAGSTVLPRYSGTSAIDEFLGDEYNERIRRQFPVRHTSFGSRPCAPPGVPPVVLTGADAGVGVVRRWACTGVLLLVGALPWLIAMATFIRQRNTALTGLLGLVFVFFMAVILGRLIKRAREAHWLIRQERRRRQHCIHHVCSTQMLMSESPPAYEIVVKSPPPYSISCDSSSQFSNQQFNNRSITVPEQFHDSSTAVPQQFHYNSGCMTTSNLHGSSYVEGRADAAPSQEILDTRISNVDDRDPNLPSYDEAVGHT